MLLNFLLFVTLKFGKHEYTIDHETTLTFNMSIAFYTKQQSEFSFKKADGTVINEIPSRLSGSDKLVVTPKGSTKSIIIITAPIFDNCDHIDYSINGIFHKSYYNTGIDRSNLNCVVMFTPQHTSKFHIDMAIFSEYIMTNDAPYLHELQYDNPFVQAETLTFGFKENLYNIGNWYPQISIVDTFLRVFGDFEVTFSGSTKIIVPIGGIFIAKNIDGFTFPDDAKDGIYDAGRRETELTISTSGEKTLYYCLCYFPPFDLYSSINAEIIHPNSPIQYSMRLSEGFGSSDRYIVIFTTKDIINYRFHIKSKFSEDKTYLKNILTFEEYKLDENTKSFVGKTFMLDCKPESRNFPLNLTIGPSDILLPSVGDEKMREKGSYDIYGDEIGGDNLNVKTLDKYTFKGKDIIKLNDGTYQILIPVEGKELDIQNNTYVVFHNAKSFTGTLDGVDILGTTGHYVFNLTDKSSPFNIKPIGGKPVVANISVLYRGTYRSGSYLINNGPQNDIIVVSPNHPVYFQISEKSNVKAENANVTQNPDKQYAFISFASSPQVCTAPYLAYNAYPDYDLKNTMLATFTIGKSSRIEFSVISHSEPETEEIYGLFIGAASYVDQSEAVFKKKNAYKVYQHGTKYKPKGKGLGSGAIAAIVIVIIIVIIIVRQQ